MDNIEQQQKRALHNDSPTRPAPEGIVTFAPRPQQTTDDVENI
jgi:hypothetical protein